MLGSVRLGLKAAQVVAQCQESASCLRQVVDSKQCARGGMADAPDLGSGSERIGGSSPLARTNNKIFTKKKRAEARYFFALN